MRVLLITPSRIVRDTFISQLIPRGIVLSWCENISNVIKKIKESNQSFDVIVIEVVSKYDVTSFLSIFRELELKGAIVLYTEIHTPSEVYEYLKLGVSGFLQKPLVTNNIFTVISKAYEHFKGAPPERKVVRVELKEGEGTVEFVSTSGIRVIANIVDLSVGGLAFSYTSKFEDAFFEGDEISRLRIILKDEETYAKGRIKAKISDKRIGIIVFTQLNLDTIQKISKFIFLKIST
ncbi:MAG: response regulator [Spirochaetes bacterium]|nr:response regulator [Spirochaetota bacterium]